MVQLNLLSVVCKRPDSVWPRHGVLGFGTIYSSATLGNSLIYFLGHIEASTLNRNISMKAREFKPEIVNFLHNLPAMTMTTIFIQSQISTDFYSNILTIWEHEDKTTSWKTKYYHCFKVENLESASDDICHWQLVVWSNWILPQCSTVEDNDGDCDNAL